MPGKVVITGGTGFIGRHLVPYLQDAGHDVTIMTTRSDPPEQSGIKFFKWNPGFDPEPDLIAEIAGSDAVINLAGATVAKRWSHAYKNEMYQSRINSTFTIVSAINQTKDPPALLINASAVGYYGDRGQETLSEESAPGTDFLARLASSWEDEAKKVNNYITRLVITRFGAVFGADGGAFPTLYNLFSKGRGTRFGDQDNWMPWIHIDDVCRALLFVMNDSQHSGIYNIVSPNPVDKNELQDIVAEELNLKSLMKAPKSLVRFIGGEGAVSELYTSERVFPLRLMDAGFDFKHADIRDAVASLILQMRPD